MFIWLSFLYMWSYWFEEGIIHFVGLFEREEQEEQEDDWRAAWINLRLAKVGTIPISEFSCVYLENYMHLSLNPSTLMASETLAIGNFPLQ